MTPPSSNSRAAALRSRVRSPTSVLTGAVLPVVQFAANASTLGEPVGSTPQMVHPLDTNIFPLASNAIGPGASSPVLFPISVLVGAVSPPDQPAA